MLSSETVADKIFKILKGNGHIVEVFTDEGKSTVDTTEARRFYLPDAFTMVNLDETDNRRELKVSISAGTQLDQLKDTLKQLKNLANQSIIEYTLKTYSKQIKPKDFDYQAQKVRDMNTVSEAIGAAYGSTKSSYQKLESAKLIIKHNKAVNEEQRGSRSRNIQAIYIENADGERYKLATNNLAGGRAMLRHVKEGGTPYDEFGQHLAEQCNELKKLKEFKRYTERNGLVNEDTSDILEAVTNRINSIRESLSKSKGSKGYARFVEEFKAKESTINEDDLSEIKDKFTVRTFDEGLDEALPYVNALIKEMQAVREADDFARETLDSLVASINNAKAIRLRPGTDIKNDPENPLVNNTVKNAAPQVQLGAIFEYFSSVIDGGKDQDQLSVLLARMNDLVDNVKDRAMLNTAANAIRQMMPKFTTKASEETTVISNRNPWEQRIEEMFGSYDINKLFN
jgi:hypothetical protein|tara:strand:+ start:9117 stop:10484 length:1368 start_codon:yes stop_codon:yes gene_type:complete